MILTASLSDDWNGRTSRPASKPPAIAIWSTTATPTPACVNQQAVVELVTSKSRVIFSAALPKARRRVWPNGVVSGEEITRSPARSAGLISLRAASG